MMGSSKEREWGVRRKVGSKELNKNEKSKIDIGCYMKEFGCCI